MSGGESYWSLVESVCDDISIYDGAELFLQQWAAAPAAARSLFAAHWCYSEVVNGGFEQFFYNSTGLLAPEAVQAFHQIGRPRLASVVQEAVDWFGPSFPRDRTVRQEALAECEESHPAERNPFESLDDHFYDLMDIENGGFEVAADAYAVANCRTG